MTLTDMKKELKDRRLKTSGRKAELEERLKESTSLNRSTDIGRPSNVKKPKTESGMSMSLFYYIQSVDYSTGLQP